MKNSEVLMRLRTILPAINAVPNVNRGGCCVVAAAIARQLQKVGVEVEVVSLGGGDHYGSPPADARCNLHRPPKRATNYDWDRAGLSRGHLGARFKLGKAIYTVDSTTLARRAKSFGERGDVCAYPFGMGLTPEEATIMANKSKGWNSTFNRKKYKAIVERLVAAAFA